MAAGHSLDPERWRAHFDGLMGRIAGRFTRVEPRRHARDLVLGLLSDLPGKNCWTIAEHAGHAGPGRLQHLLARATWDADGVRDDLRGYVTGHLGDEDAVLVVDETGDLKKGTRTVGVQRQYTGTAGRIENTQVAVYLTYATRAGHALIDRALYLPRSWADDPARRAAAGVPQDAEFATKPALARQMITRALDGGATARWVAGDEVYGADPGLRRAWRTAGSDTCWRSPAATGSPPPPARSAPTPLARACPARPGSGCPPAGAPRAPLLRLGLDQHRSRAPHLPGSARC